MKQKIKRILKKILSWIYGFYVRRSAGRCGKKLCVNGFTKLGKNTFLGDNVSFNGMRICGEGKVTIGSNFHSGPGCLMITQNHNYDSGESIPYDSTYIYKPINIGDNVWIGARVIILCGVTIGEGAVIQAGSVVVSDIPALAIAGGHPAKVFKMRNEEHYYSKKNANKFL